MSALGEMELTHTEFRALLEASRCGRIDNARMRQVTGLDTLSASRVLRRLCDRELLALHHAGAASYYAPRRVNEPAAREGGRPDGRGG